MNIVIAPDSFKESMTALEAANAIEEGFKAILPEATYVKVPMADGGEGTVQSIIDATGGEMKKMTVTGPLNTPVEAFYGLSGDKKIAVIEMAASSGLDKVNPTDRNPLKTTTLGFGELIKGALDEGVNEILLGIGGSATNDAGAGMIISLGGKLLDKNGESIEPTGEGLAELETIDVSGMHPRIKEVSFRVACDVDNPLTGENGASYIYGPQKGGTEEQLEHLDQNLAHFAKKVTEYLEKDIENVPGAGAAGGLGGGLMAFLDAQLQRGGDLLVEMLDLENKIKEADLVITGEGGINHQTIFGKTPIAVSRVSKKYSVPTIALAGCLNQGYENIYNEGIAAAFSIIPEFTPLETALENGYENLRAVAKNVASVYKLSHN
ncbi:glycerate kinase [Alkalibacterium sp. MB6]|uniref:glycerate kinase n=1 Tax=Alkalibacterium sp. MB6 TaxID=2081965 RepID=UPI00137AA82F|nr:glycerate kinase [Alkalibacterium sp. MB6]